MFFYFSKMLPKGMHQIRQIEFQKYIFSAFQEAHAPSGTPFFLQFPKIYLKKWYSFTNREGARIRNKNSQYFIRNKWIFSKMLAKGMHQIAQIEFENCIFSSFRGGNPPQTPSFIFSMPKDWKKVLVKVSNRKGWRNRRDNSTNWVPKMYFFFKLLKGHIPLRRPLVHAGAETGRWRTKSMYQIEQLIN